MLPPPRRSMSGAAARASATREYALMSIDCAKSPRVVRTNGSAMASRDANATACTRKSRPSRKASVSAIRDATSSSRVTSQRTRRAGWRRVSASARAFFSNRSVAKLRVRRAPAASAARAIAQASDRLLATPTTRPRAPARSAMREVLARPDGRMGSLRGCGFLPIGRRAAQTPSPPIVA